MMFLGGDIFNYIIIKHLYSILVVDELFRELYKDFFFLNHISFDCYQNLMNKSYIFKMNFNAHQGHYKFLIMFFNSQMDQQPLDHS